METALDLPGRQGPPRRLGRDGGITTVIDKGLPAPRGGLRAAA